VEERATIDDLDSAKSELEELCADLENKLDELTGVVDTCARQDDLTANVEKLTEEIETARSALETEIGTVRDASEENKSRIQELTEQLKKTTERANLGIMRPQLDNAVTQSEVKCMAAIRNADKITSEKLTNMRKDLGDMNKSAASLSTKVDSKADKTTVLELSTTVSGLPTQEQVQTIQTGLQQGINENLERIEKNVQQLKRHANELEQQRLKLSSKVSKTEMEATEQSILNVYATKDETVQANNHTGLRIDRLTAKLVEFDKRLHTSQNILDENQERIDQLGPALLQNVEQKMQQSTERQQEQIEKSRVDIAAITSEDTSKVLEVYSRTQAELEYVHEALREVREIMEGKHISGDQQSNHALWQQMIAFRKLFVLAGGKEADTGFIENTTRPMQPSPPDGGPSSASQGGGSQFRTTADKQRWEKEDQQRWMVDNRMGQQQGGGLPSI